MRTREDQFSRLVMAAEPRPFWLDQPGAPPARAPLRGEAAADLVVIGGGFTGLWTALLAKESFPERSVVLVEGHRVGWAASGRNGGFCDASLTHGAVNGRARFGDEFATLQRLGAENLDAIGAAVDRHGIDCDFERTGLIGVATFATLAAHFFATFSQLEGTGFSHRWGGVIDTCSRFCAFFGTAHRGRVAYALGYTGLGVGASRFGARVMLDLLSGEPTELTELRLVRSKPVPFPPEPLAYLGIQATRWSLARADRRAGHRNLWLRALDAAGLGFDS